ncbi:hypothetical protein H9Y04_07340 [Streptomyces sp. TRM66268-LWL]|uniref:Lipoprotein n=1 Tax=Streptomyces polyasparticus TaxID=2767826 RepID=A0ABR7SB52_9ACTN|nr:hypothetical protein [Streptomyces polyasparticus]MBC9712384.1 hypothetical protein [Streptomyces polyasparticus]
MRLRPHIAQLACAAALFAVVGCSGASDDPVPEIVTGSLEEIAAKADCEPNVQTDAAELRQANCRNGEGRFILTTFATARGQREWINEANDYGGTYLVGRKWVASGEEKVVMSLRGRLGGTVERAGHHSGSSGAGGNGHTGGHQH